MVRILGGRRPRRGGGLLATAAAGAILVLGCVAAGAAWSARASSPESFPGVFPVASSLLPTVLGRPATAPPVVRTVAPDQQLPLAAVCLRNLGWDSEFYQGGITTDFGSSASQQRDYRRQSRDLQTCIDQYPVDPLIAHAGTGRG